MAYLKLRLFVFITILTLSYDIAVAQKHVSYFVGKWDVLAKIPTGDKQMLFEFKDESGQLTGALLDASSHKILSPVNVKLRDNMLSLQLVTANTKMVLTLKPNGINELKGVFGTRYPIHGIRIYNSYH